MEEHARNVDGIRDALSSLEGRMDRRFEGVDARFTALEQKMDRRFEALDANLNARFALIEGQITRLTTSVMTALAAVVAVAGGLLFALR